MGVLSSVAAWVGYAVMLLWLLGALGVGEFELYYGPAR